MTNASLVCWKCAASLETFSLPLERLAECKACHADLHVCRMCQFYNPKLSDHCDESMADYVTETERANFCDYFKPKLDAYIDSDKSQSTQVRAELDALFGKSSNTSKNSENTEDPRTELEKLFGKNKKNGDSGV